MAGDPIEKKVTEVLASRKKSNNIIELYNLMQKDETSRVSCIKALERIFKTFLERKEFSTDSNLKIANPTEYEIETKYVNWLKDIYEKTLQQLYKLVDSNEENLEGPTLDTLMLLLSTEAEHPLDGENKEAKSGFPELRLQKIIQILLSNNVNKSSLINCFGQYVEYKDIFYYTWKVLKKVIPCCRESDEKFMLNALEVLKKVPMPLTEQKSNEKSEEGTRSFCKWEGNGEFVLNEAQVKKFMNRVWQNLVNRNMGAAVHRKLMVTLLELYLANLENPIYLTDFFVSSANLGGANALLAMQGILNLVQKHNIEYPNIYGKLYNMFEPNIFHTKYKSRLFYLADIFLSSTHLPENLVASFAKRVSRLSLKCQIPDILIGVRFVENLLLRHPGLKKLIHHHEIEPVAEDPFLPDEADPMKTNALESSLWEVALLKHHVQPVVSSAAGFIDRSLPQMELDLKELLDGTIQEVFAKEAKKRSKPCQNIMRPEKMARLSDDRVYSMWALA